MCAKLRIRRPVLVGHSLGGVVDLRLAHLYPELLAGLVALDAAIAVAPEVAEFTPVLARLQGLDDEEYRSAAREVLGAFFHPHDDPARREMIINTMASCRKDVFLSGWLETVVHTDSIDPLASLQVPMLYVAAQTSDGGLEQIRAGANVTVAQTTGSGHFIELECPARSMRW